jgi:hypothetical protein
MSTFAKKYKLNHFVFAHMIVKIEYGNQCVHSRKVN